MFGELADGQKLVVIRWNPDAYVCKKGMRKNQTKRMEALKDHIIKVINNPPEELLYIYYMFYDDQELINRESSNVTRSLPYTMLF